MKSYLHHSGIVSDLATPVTVLARGPKRAHVRLIHRLRWNREWFPAGSTRYVPSDCLGEQPSAGALVSIGLGVFVRQDSAQGRKVVSR